MGIQVIPVIEELIFIPFWWALLSPPPPDPLTLLVVYYLSATPNNTYLHFNHKAQESLGYSFSHLLFPSELCVPRQCFPGVCVCVLHTVTLCLWRLAAAAGAVPPIDPFFASLWFSFSLTSPGSQLLWHMSIGSSQ